MDEFSIKGLVGLLGLVLYIVVKDLTIPLLRRWQNNRHPSSNPANAGLAEIRGDLKAAISKFDAQWEEQKRVNVHVEKNITRLFERLDEEKKHQEVS